MKNKVAIMVIGETCTSVKPMIHKNTNDVIIIDGNNPLEPEPMVIKAHPMFDEPEIKLPKPIKPNHRKRGQNGKTKFF